MRCACSPAHNDLVVEVVEENEFHDHRGDS